MHAQSALLIEIYILLPTLNKMKIHDLDSTRRETFLLVNIFILKKQLERISFPFFPFAIVNAFIHFYCKYGKQTYFSKDFRYVVSCTCGKS